MIAIKQEYLPHYTYNDYLLWEGKWELIYGVPYAMSPAPNKKHQWVQKKILFELEKGLKKCHFCSAFLPIDWKIDEETVVQPDLLVVCGEKKEGQYLEKTPAIIFEILSPSTAFKDRNLKFELYQAAGVKYYCLVDPEKEKVEIYQLSEKQYQNKFETQNEDFWFEIENCSVLFEFKTIWEL